MPHFFKRQYKLQFSWQQTSQGKITVSSQPNSESSKKKDNKNMKQQQGQGNDNKFEKHFFYCKQPPTEENGFQIYHYLGLKKENIKNLQEYKTILLLGKTGAGKTTLINLFINYYLGVSYEDNIRFVLIQEEQREAAESQTQDINIYYIEPTNNNPGLIIIDTPGFADTRGYKKDEELMKQIKQLFEKDIQTLTAICFVMKYTDMRIDPQTNYVMNAMISIFGKDIMKNLMFMFTFCEKVKRDFDPMKNLSFAGHDQQSKSVFTDLIPIMNEPKYFLLTNDVVKDEKDDITQMYWNKSYQNFKTFVEFKIKLTKDASLQLTRDVLRERERILNLAKNLKEQVEISIVKMQNLDNLKYQISNLNDKINSNEAYINYQEYSDPIKENLEPGQCTTNCIKCNKTCHFPCSLGQDQSKEFCASMKDGYCTVCPNKCPWKDHNHEIYQWKLVKATKKVTIASMKNRYFNAKSEKSVKEQIKKGIEREFLEEQVKFLDNFQQLVDSINRLDEIALKPAVWNSYEEYFDDMIKEEEKLKNADSKEKLDFLEKQKEYFQIIRKVAGNKKLTPQQLKEILLSNQNLKNA